MAKRLLLPILVGCLSIRGMAVDHKKFRNCEKTSFCRRHRDGHLARLYKYQVDVESIHFRLPPSKVPTDEETNNEEEKEDANKGSTGGIWKSLSDRILGSSDDGKHNEKDPYVRGPPPTLTGFLINSSTETSSGSKEKLEWSIHAMADGLIRMRVTEVYQTSGTPYEKARVTYDELVLSTETMDIAEHAQWIRPGDSYLFPIVGEDQAKNHMGLQYGDVEGEPGMFLLIRLDSFAVFLYREAELKSGPIVAVGEKNMMHFEVRRLRDSDKNDGNDKLDDEEEVNTDKDEGKEDKEGKPEKEIVGYWEDGLAIYSDGTREERKDVEEDHRQLTEVEMDREGMWEEHFQSHHDSKPHGPMSVGMDITFPKSKHLYGLPEHASSTVLKTTRGEGAPYDDPFRLYNLDVFEYDLDEPMALYGEVPLVISQSIASGTSGVFWFNPTETFVDVMDGSDESKVSHWMSESGVLDLFLIPGPTPVDFYRQYARLTGTMPLPPMFSLGKTLFVLFCQICVSLLAAGSSLS